MAELKFVKFYLEWSGMKDDNRFFITLIGDIDHFYPPDTTHFKGSVQSGFSDGFFLPDTVWSNLKELTVDGKLKEGEISYICVGESGNRLQEIDNYPCKITLEQAEAVTKDDVPGHWIRFKYEFDLKDLFDTLCKFKDDYTFKCELKIKGTFNTKRYWKFDFDDSISKTGVVNLSFKDEDETSYTRFRAIAYSKATGYKTAKDWTRDLEKAEQDMLTMQEELADTHFGFAIEREDKPEPNYKAPPTEYHNRIYGTVIGKAIRIPIAGAQISFGGKTTFSDNEGKYELKDVFYSGPIYCSATGYKTATEYIEAPIEGDLEVNFELERLEAPQIDISPIAPPLQGMDKELSAANEIAKQQLDAAKTQGEIPEPAIETALRQVGLDDWADKYHEIYEWLNDTFGVEMPDPKDPTKKRKAIILTAGFAGGLGALASKLGLNTAKGALTRAGGAIAATIGGLKASSILKGITGIVGTVVFAEFICEEAVQTAGMGVYMASQTKDPEVVRQALENYKNILDATKQIHDTVKYIDPIGSTFEAFFVASENNITNYEKLIERLEDREKEKTKEEIKELNRSLLDRLFIANLISEEDYRSKLRDLGYTDADIDLLVALAETKKEVRVEEPKLLSKSDILRAYKEELIDEDTAKNKLRALNYTDEDIELMLNMSAKEKLGKLRVTSKPTHAQIIINDNPVNLLTSETMELPPGTYAVTVSLEGYKIPDAKEVTIEEEGRAEVHFDLERMKIGYLSLRSRPSQAAIYINGVDTKLLTPQKFELEEGTYTITLKYNGYEDREIEVEIKENETVERFVRLVRKAE